MLYDCTLLLPLRTCISEVGCYHDVVILTRALLLGAITASYFILLKNKRRLYCLFSSISTGSRGAVSAEYLLRLDYAVIFLYRRNSMIPFTSRCCRPDGPYSTTLDAWFDLEAIAKSNPSDPPKLNSSFAHRIAETVQSYVKYSRFFYAKINYFLVLSPVFFTFQEISYFSLTSLPLRST